VSFSGVARAEEPSLVGEPSLTVGGSSSLLGGPLVSGGESLVGGQASAGLVGQTNLVTVERESSAKLYEGIGGEAAEALVGQDFPGVVNIPDGGSLSPPEGSRILEYSTDSAAALEFSGGGHGALESLVPVAVEVSGGQRVPIDLGLDAVGDGFQPRVPFTGAHVSIPKRLADGPSMKDIGVSLTPVADGQGVSLGGAEGVVDGTTVFYANTEDPQAGVFDMDTMVKPDTFGFSTVSLLRSQRSPEKLFFTVGLPEGASLVASGAGGSVQVVQGGEVIATVRPPVARDARGTLVPVVMTVSGTVLTVVVAHRTGNYFYPILVDPTVQEKYFHVKGAGQFLPGNWQFATNNEVSLGRGASCNEHETECSIGMADQIVWNGTKYVWGEYTAGQYAHLTYQTQKESRIYELTGTAYVVEELPQEHGRVEGRVAIQSSAGVTEKGAEVGLPSTEWTSEKGARPYEKNVGLCVEAGCATGTVATSHENNVFFEVHVDESGNKSFTDELKRGASIGILQETGPSAAQDTTDATLGGLPNGFYGGGGKWVNASQAKVGVTAKDPGIGVNAFSISSPQASGWGHGFTGLEGCQGVQCDECWNWSSQCTGGQSTSGEPIIAGLTGLPDGKDTVEVKVENATTESSSTSGTVNVDSSPPYNIKLVGLPPGNEIGKGTYKIKAEATDGTSVESSGVASISATLDGKALTIPSAKCAPGPCTAGSEWSLVGTELAGGRHQLVITATDGVGNVAVERVALVAHPAAGLTVGPGSVNPYTGEFKLSVTDVSVGGGLTVTRAFGSRHLSAGAEGPLGAQWGLGLGGQESLVKQADGSMVLNAADGEQTIFSIKEGGFTSPPGDANLTLSNTPCETGKTEYMLKNAAGNITTCFRAPTGGSGELFVPSIVKGVVATDTVSYAYETVEVPSGSGKKITRPTEALAPVPAGVSCSPELKKGCRALTFNYAATTTASGERPSEWGDYQGNLTRVFFNGWDPVSKEMKREVAIAQYSYDKQGRLRAEWDPRITPVLKTLYGYDEEGHVAAISPPGQESWGFVYGTMASDTSRGRLLKLTRAPITVPVSSGEAPVNTAVPTLTGTTVEGMRLSVSTGSWSNNPVVYGYRWEDCNYTGGECTLIPGAVNGNYTLSGRDVEHTIVAQVVAVNGGGAIVASSAHSSYVAHGAENGAPAGTALFKHLSKVSDLAIDPSSGNLLVAMGAQNRVQELSPEGNLIREIGLSGSGNPSLKWAGGVTADQSGNIWVSDREDNRIEEFNPGGVFIRTIGSEGPLKSPEGLRLDGSGNVWVADSNDNRIDEFTPEGTLVKTIGTEQLSHPEDVAFASNGELWVADTHHNRIAKFTTSGSLSSTVGTEGTGSLQFKEPMRLTVGPQGDIWVSDTNNNRYQILSSAGGYLYQYASQAKELASTHGVAFNGAIIYEGAAVEVTKSWMDNAYDPEDGPPAYSNQFGTTGSGQLAGATDIANDASGNVWVADGNNNRIVEFNGEGTFVRAVGSEGTENGKFKRPEGVEVDSKGDIWVSDTNNNRIEEFGPEGVFLRSCGTPQLNLPEGLAADNNGNIYVADANNNRIDKFNPECVYQRSFGEYGTGEGKFYHPNDVAIDNTGNIWVTDLYNYRIEEFNSSYVFIHSAGGYGNGNGQFNQAKYMAIGSQQQEGDIWVADQANKRVEVFSATGGYKTQFTPHTTVNAIAFHAGNIYLSNSFSVEKWLAQSTGGETILQAPQPGATIEYGAPLLASGLPTMTTGEVEKWGQKDDPVEAIAIFPPDEPQRWPASDYKRASVNYLDGQGRTVNMENPGGAVATAEYNETNDVVRTLTPDNQAAALREGVKSVEVSKLLDTQSTYNSEGTELLSSLGPRHLVRLPNGKEVQARSHTVNSYDEGAPSEGGPYRLITKVSQGAQIEAEPEQDVRTITNSYSGQSDLGWKLRRPTSTTADPTGLKITHTTIYDETTGNVLETWTPKSTGAGSPHDTKTVYYKTESNPSYPSCGEHPEWANMPCETLPGKQPETQGLPALPVTSTTYNMWSEPETTMSTSGSSTRTTKNVYDTAGRITTSETVSTVGKTLPKVSYEYDGKTGALTKTSTGSGETTQSVISEYNRLGQLSTYTDASKYVTKYEYEPEGDARPTKINDPKGTQTYTYDATTGALKELVDSSAKTFAAGYDIEGNMTSEKYPNGMTATYTLDPTGNTTGLIYKKETNCTEHCEWFNDNIIPSIHGQWMTQTSSLGKDAYAYDQTGRLTETQATPAGKGCVTRRYAYDEDTNRTTLTTYQPNSKNECSTETSTVEKHTYDEADRLTDTGTNYDPFGNTEKLSANDAGGSELKSSFYTDNQVSNQEQNGQTIGYNTDPTGRTSEIVSTGKIVATETLHYDGPTSTPNWTNEPSGKTTRNITAIGGLTAIQHETETPILQITNLHGDIVATATDTETATELASTITEPTEYGVPATETPPKYSWLGSHEIPTMLPSGVTAMGARSYIPQLGRFLQTDPIPGGSTNTYAYTNGNPLNETDLTGKYDITLSTTLVAAENKQSEEEAARGIETAATETAARAEAERKAAEAAAQAAAYAAIKENEWMNGEGYEEGPEEEWEEEGEEEYVAWHHMAGTEHEADNTEEGLLFQPLGESAKAGSKEEPKQGVRRDVAGGCPSTHSPCYPHRHISGSRNEGGTGCRNRSGCGRGPRENPWDGFDTACATLGWTTAVTRLGCTVYGALRAGSHH
jgi:RHS repeat-associated protein